MGFARTFDLSRLMERYGCRVFFETGTGTGTGLAFAAEQSFDKLFSVEIHEGLAQAATEKFAPDARVSIYQGTSDAALNDILPTLPADQPVLFWLDAHFPGADFSLAKYNDEKEEAVRLPLERELRLILQHRPDSGDVILIDDLRIYEDGPFQHGNMPAHAQTLPPERRHTRFVADVVGATHTIGKFYLHEGYLVLLPRGHGSPGPLLTEEPALVAPPPEGPAHRRLGHLSGPRAAEFGRDESPVQMVDLLKKPPQRVLDIGCATGLRGALVKQRFPNAQVVGLEPTLAAAERAIARLDMVAAAPIERFDFAAAGVTRASQDIIFLGDMLELSYNPWALLQFLRTLLAPGGQLIARVQNLRNLRVLEALAKGAWSYAASGPLNINHVRFFTRREVVRLFQECGFRVTQSVGTPDPQLTNFLESSKGQDPADIDIPGVLTLRQVSQQDRLEFVMAHLIVTAESAG